MKIMLQPACYAEGLPAGAALPVNPWKLDPAHELPGRRCPMFVLPPPRRSLLRRTVAALCGLGSTVATGASMMLLAQYLTTPS